MERLSGVALGLAVFAAACGTDKNYGEPLSDPNAGQIATATVDSVLRIELVNSNEAGLRSLDSATGGFNQLTGLKYQEQQGGFDDDEDFVTERRSQVDENCVEVSATEIRYSDCEYGGTIVNGEVSLVDSRFEADLRFVATEEDEDGVMTRTTDVRADLQITEESVIGYIDSDLDIRSPQFRVRGSLDGDFDVLLADGCAIGGSLEMHAVARAGGQSQDIWALAEFGPACGDVTVR